MPTSVCRRLTLSLAVVAVMLLALAASGCSSSPGDPKPSVTVAALYIAPTPTPVPCPTPAPRPSTSWNGMFVKLYGNISVNKGEHIYGTIKVNYMNKEYWEDHPTARYDTADEGGAYSLDVRAKVPFKVEMGYLYVGRLPEVMNVRRLDNIYVIEEDTALNLEVMTSNITPVN